MIELRNVSKAFGRAQVLHNTSFAVAAKSLGVLRGPNGSGKSTALKIAAGLALADAGTRHTTATRIGYVGHAHQMLPSLSVERNLRYQTKLWQLPEDRLRAAAEFFGVSGYWQKRPGQVSQGMLQRAKLARAFAIEPDLLVLDEPQAGLDDAGRVLLWAGLCRSLGAGAAVLIASHEAIPAHVGAAEWLVTTINFGGAA